MLDCFAGDRKHGLAQTENLDRPRLGVQRL